MYDVIGKATSIILGLLVIILGSTTIYATKMDTQLQNHVSYYTQDFVNTSRATGMIEKQQYEKFIKELDSTGQAYRVEILHYKEKTAPVKVQRDLNGDGVMETTTEYKVYYDTFNKEEILNTIATRDANNLTSDYAMNVGDFIKVTVVNMKPTLGRKLLGFFTGRPTTQGGQIRASYGGYIGND